MPGDARDIPLWGRFEARFNSDALYENLVQDARFRVTFVAPSGIETSVDGFWDGADEWAVRFSPSETGEWTYVTECSDTGNKSLNRRTGGFRCVPATGTSRFATHGAVRVSDDHRYLTHADGTPFFWMADTAWNGALLSTPDEWEHYLRERVGQGYSAVQWVATQWRASPDGDRDGRKAFEGRERIRVDPEFFRRLDARLDAINRSGMVGAPVMLWENSVDSAYPDSNPGHVLPQSQAILLGRYMAARWGANAVVWILMGDWRYQPENAERWRGIGRGIFGTGIHAPVATHVRSRVFLAEEFRDEDWLEIVGYQTGHSEEESCLRWIHSGDIASEWDKIAARVIMNLEPNYEDHVSAYSGERFDSLATRRACYWSLLNAPTAGVTYGGHGVWGWDDGTAPAVDHPKTGIPQRWQDAIHLPGGEQMAHVAALFTSIEWWRLRPAPGLVSRQPGETDAARHVSASRTDAGDLAVVYTPQERVLELNPSVIGPGLRAIWFNPRIGTRTDAAPHGGAGEGVWEAPGEGDWVLLFERSD